MNIEVCKYISKFRVFGITASGICNIPQYAKYVFLTVKSSILLNWKIETIFQTKQGRHFLSKETSFSFVER